jgi:hypothetical protein
VNEDEEDDEDDEAVDGAEAEALEPPRPSNVEHADSRASAAIAPTPHAHIRALPRRCIVPSMPVAVLYPVNRGVPKAALRRHATAL